MNGDQRIFNRLGWDAIYILWVWSHHRSNDCSLAHHLPSKDLSLEDNEISMCDYFKIWFLAQSRCNCASFLGWQKHNSSSAVLISAQRLSLLQQFHLLDILCTV